MAQYSRKLKKGLRWYYKFDYENKTYFSNCIYLSKGEAKKAENARFEEVSTNATTPSLKPILSLREAIENRLDLVKVKKSERYYKENKKQYLNFLNCIGDIPINEVNKSAINSYLLKMSQELQTAGKDNYSVNATLRILKALFNYAIANSELNIKNPCQGVSMYPVIKRMKYIPTDKEINDVLALCDEGQKLLIEFVKETGARISEALRVTGKDIGKDYVVLHTRKSANSNLVPRRVPLSIKLPSVSEDQRLFSRWTDAPDFLEDKIHILKQRNWNWHNLRHRYASLLSKKGTPLFEIMILLGHSQISTTQNYLQLLP